ncbi:MAG: sensor histidine kinase [Oscillospiraceae bacterium]|nr:sensor histidine kinase [Oscillospiraceae bacterium]
MEDRLALILVIITIALGAFAMAYGSYCYSTASSGLRTRARSASQFFSNYMTVSYNEYYSSALEFVASFEEKNNLELQFINTSGRIMISSYGLPAGEEPGTPDISAALKNGEISIWQGNSPSTNERIMAASAPLMYGDRQIIGVLRYVTSLENIDRQIKTGIVFASAVGVAMLILVIMSNVYFIRSIVNPIGEITATARRIADGSYGVQINKRYNDEIGLLVDTINDMSARIDQSEKTETEFISSVSHELRTPLTAITGWAETLLSDGTIDPVQKRGVEIIMRETNRLSKLVENLLDFSRMQGGHFTIHVEKMDVTAELEDTIYMYRSQLEKLGMEIDYFLDENIPQITGDPERLRQVFLNILNNAAKYGRSGNRISVTATCNEKCVIIKIRDYGPGIPEDELPQVKWKFYKGSSKERGSGIGLAVCDEIVRLHKGDLIIENARGGGVLVTVVLPIQQS